jgi:hypothetical protein
VVVVPAASSLSSAGLYLFISLLAVCIFNVIWHYIVAEAGCNWYLDINILSL